MDDIIVTTSTLLDLSAAFNSIDHTILLRILSDWFGVTDKAVDWFTWYLTGLCLRIELEAFCPLKLISLLETVKGQI